jgi:very-short-patch-repair endonuclease
VPFLTRDARAAGIPKGRLEAHDLDRSVWGVRSTDRDATVAARCSKFALRLRDDTFFSHTTAALLYGAPLPPEVEASAALHISAPSPAPRPHARGILGHSLSVPEAELRTRAGLRLTSPTRTWLDLGGMLSLGDLVAVGDYFIHWRAPLATEGELRNLIDAQPAVRGIRRLRRALELLNDRAESRPESLLRVIVVCGGLPAPRVNYVVVQTETGRNVRLDLAFVEQKLVLEYQGDYHRSRAQWRRDMTRRTRLEAQGWRVMELNADDLLDPDELVARIDATLALPR